MLGVLQNIYNKHRAHVLHLYMYLVLAKKAAEIAISPLTTLLVGGSTSYPGSGRLSQKVPTSSLASGLLCKSVERFDTGVEKI